MPYLGLFPFLRGDDTIDVAVYDVSMPYLGLFPFLPTKEYPNLEQETVSMPYLGLFPFLRYALQRRINTAFREPFLRVIHRIF